MKIKAPAITRTPNRIVLAFDLSMIACFSLDEKCFYCFILHLSPAHGEPFVGLHERLDTLYQSHLTSIERLRAALEIPRRVEDLLEVLFSKEIGSDPMQKWLATGETRANPNYLLASREVVVDVDLNGIHWFRNA